MKYPDIIEVYVPKAMIQVVPEGTLVPGPPGPPGEQGPPGEPGPPGATGKSTSDIISYNFSSNNAEPPTGSQVRLNSVDATAATLLWATKNTSDNADPTFLFNLWVRVGNQIGFQDKDDSSKRQRYQITGPLVDKGAYFEVPVSWLGGGSVPISSSAGILLVMAGDFLLV